MPDSHDADALAQRLLDAQVAHHLERLTGEQAATTVARLTEDALDAGGHHQLEDLVDRDAVKTLVVRALATVPGSAAVSGIVEMAVSVVHEGPATPYPLGELVDRDQVEALLDQVLALHPLLERGLERLTASPQVGAAASRFMGRVVGEVVQANKAMADRLPGLGSLFSLGTSAATALVGAADKQLEGLLAETAGKGGTYAVRRLNKIIVETVRDPTTRAAVLEVWDLAAQRPVTGAGDRPADEASPLAGVVGAAHDLVVTTLADEEVARLAEVVVDGFFDRFGGYTPTELLDELDLARDDIVADAVRIAPRVLDALRESGDLERLLRSQLEPFWSSPEARDLLG